MPSTWVTENADVEPPAMTVNGADAATMRNATDNTPSLWLAGRRASASAPASLATCGDSRSWNSFVLGETILVGWPRSWPDDCRRLACTCTTLDFASTGARTNGRRAHAQRVKIDASSDKHDGTRLHSVKAPTQRGGAMNSPTDVFADDHTELLTEITPTEGRTRPILDPATVRRSVSRRAYAGRPRTRGRRRGGGAAGLGRAGHDGAASCCCVPLTRSTRTPKRSLRSSPVSRASR